MDFCAFVALFLDFLDLLGKWETVFVGVDQKYSLKIQPTKVKLSDAS